MYKIVRTKDFKTSIKKLSRSGINLSTVTKIKKTIDLLVSGGKLVKNYKDHQLRGKLSKYRECHIKSDLLLIYRLEKKDLILILVDIGSHSDLF